MGLPLILNGKLKLHVSQYINAPVICTVLNAALLCKNYYHSKYTLLITAVLQKTNLSGQNTELFLHNNYINLHKIFRCQYLIYIGSIHYSSSSCSTV